MALVKKLVFGPLFLISFTFLIYLFSRILTSTEFIFALGVETLIQLAILSGIFLLASLFFILFGAFSLNWKFILPVVILASLIPFIFIPAPLALVLSTLLLTCFILSYTLLELKMRTYLTFQPTQIFSPSIKQLTGLLILALSIIYYFSINNEIAQKGFQIPDSLIDTALKFTPIQSGLTPQPNLGVQGFKYDSRYLAQTPQLTKEQIDLLKKNPDLLKQYGIDPKMLENLEAAQSPGSTNQRAIGVPNTNFNDLIKQTVKDQFQNMIKPYQSFIPAVLAFFLFITLHSLTSLLSIFLSPLIWLTFLILEKTKFITFTTETREVKKMVA